MRRVTQAGLPIEQMRKRRHQLRGAHVRRDLSPEERAELLYLQGLYFSYPTCMECGTGCDKLANGEWWCSLCEAREARIRRDSQVRDMPAERVSCRNDFDDKFKSE